MPKRNRSKKMRGGLFGLFEGSSTSDSSSEGTGWLDSLKKKTGSASSWFSSDPATTTTPPVNNSYQPQSPSYGGKRRRRKSRRMRGGYSDNVSMTNLASHAAPFSGETARPQAYVGGRRTKRRCHTHKRSHRRHCRK